MIEYHGWHPVHHEYDPDWDYDIQMSHLNHPVIQRAQKHLEHLAELDSTPFTPDHPGRVFPVDLTYRNDVGVYCSGTYMEPCILIDVEAHDDIMEIERTVNHEVKHAIQESQGSSLNETDAEEWNPNFG